MPLSVQLGLLLALATAFASIVGFLLKHRGAVEAPDVEWRRPVRSSIALFRSRTYTIGILVATASWGLHVAALSLAPISLVQSVIAGGLVLLTVVADRLFGLTVTRREWIGVALTAAGLATLAATLGDTGESAHSDWGAAALAVDVGLATLVGLALVPLAARAPAREGVVLAVSAGLLWGASDVTIKALSDHLGELGVAVIVHPLAAVIAALSLARPASSRRGRSSSGRRSRSSPRRARPRTSSRSPPARSSSASRCPRTRSGWRCGCSPSRWSSWPPR